jgi:hypothetical protein
MEIVKDFANAVHFFHEVDKTRATMPSGLASKEGS